MIDVLGNLTLDIVSRLSQWVQRLKGVASDREAPQPRPSDDLHPQHARGGNVSPLFFRFFLPCPIGCGCKGPPTAMPCPYWLRVQSAVACLKETSGRRLHDSCSYLRASPNWERKFRLLLGKCHLTNQARLRPHQDRHCFEKYVRINPVTHHPM